MTERYVRTSTRAFRGCITGRPGSGKTEFALAPHPALGLEPKSVVYLALDDGSEWLEGIPPEFVADGRVAVVRPGYDKDGRPLDGDAYVDAVLEFAKKKRPTVKTYIVDTVNAFSEQVRENCKAKDERKRYHEGQMAAVALYRNLYHNNRHANLLLLHHLDSRTHPGMDKSGNEIQVFESYVPKIVGKALHEDWSGKFTFVVRTECRRHSAVNPKDGGVVHGHKYFLQLRPTDDMDVLKVRAASTEKVPPELDLTVVKGNCESLLVAWDTLLKLTDTALVAQASLEEQRDQVLRLQAQASTTT